MQTKQEIVTSTHIRPFVKCLQKEACQILAFAPKQCQKNEKKRRREETIHGKLEINKIINVKGASRM